MLKDKKEKKQLQKTQAGQLLTTPDDDWPLTRKSFFEEMEQFFENPFQMGWWHPFQMMKPAARKISPPFAGKTPRVNISEEDEQFVLKAELPGVDKKDINISVSKNSVVIEATTSQEEKEEKGDYFHQEIARGSYSRTLSLPADVIEDKVKAQFKNGILTLTMPKLEKTKRTEITVE
ncbi:MAG: Hsp20/alpha crystallin family protein [Desulfocapsaceae bacterium]|jgi:HSP20 family protein|nr:Hsp20/alpha crystallin family protein [Desulfocapsaceae bacterium]